MKTIRFSLLIIVILALFVTPFLPNYPGQVVNAAGACASSAPSSNAYTVTVCFTMPNQGSSLTGLSSVTATVSVTGTDPGTRRMVFYLNGAYLLTDYQSPYTFTLPTARFVDGSYSLAVEALMRDTFTSSRATQTVTFANGVTNPPTNNKTFTPTGGTTPAPGSPFSVVATGDGAGGETNGSNVVNLIGSLNPNMFLYLGDMYEKGAPTEFYNWYGEQGVLFGRFRNISNPAIGNHEYSASSTAFGYFNYWDNVPDYYSYNAGGWHFISLNSNSVRIDVNAGSAQYNWLQQDLTANAGACTIVYFHHPYFNIGPQGPKIEMADIWQLMAQNGVDIVLTGHDHNYQRWKSLDGNGNLSATGITEFVLGAGGHGVQAFTTSDSRVAYSNASNPAAFGALKLLLNSSGASYSYHSVNGSILDSGTIACGGGGPDTQAPSVPTGLSATAASATQVNLSWSAATDNVGVSGYTIYRGGASLGTVASGVLNYTDNTAQPGTTYSYRVDAFDAAGNHSAQSSPASVTTPALPASLTFTPVADAYVNAGSPTSKYGTATTLRADASPDLHSYIRFTVQGLGGTPIVRARLRLLPSNANSLGLNALRVADNSWSESTLTYNNAPTLGSQIASSGAITAGTWLEIDVTSYVTGEGTYSFGVTTPSTSTISFASRETTNDPQLVIDFTGGPAPDTQAPSTPGSLAAAAASPTQVNLTWQAATDNVGVTGYTVYRNGASLTTVSGNVLNYSDTTASAGTSYSYTVDAFDAAGNHSSQSSPAAVTTPSGADTQAPSVPSGLSATSPAANQVNLGWQAATDNVGVSGYTIYRNGASLTTVAGNVLTYSDTTVSAGTTYSYTVDAYDAAGNHSAQSSPASVTTGSGQGSTTLTLTPVADTYVNSGSPTTTYGTSTTLRADASPDVHSYLRFNVQGTAGKSVVSARLRLFANSSNSGGIRALQVADNSWVESSTNYNNAPALGSQIAASAAITTGSWVEVDVTGYITADGLYSFGITTPSSTALSLASKESTNVPQLIIDIQ